MTTQGTGPETEMPAIQAMERDRLRLAAINFLNPAPLMWDFEHAPLSETLARRYDVHSMAPSQCALQLAMGVADIGLVPIAAYVTTPDLAVLPGCTVASKGAIRSLLLVYREHGREGGREHGGKRGGLDGIRTVAADTSSLATFAYVQVLFKKFWRVPASFTPHPPHLDSMLQSCDAAILIGDPALLALEDRQAREQRTGERLVYLDLGSVWREATGLPWVSAFWAVRKPAVASAQVRGRVCEDFLASRDHGLLHLEEIVHEWAPRIAIPEETIRTYLTGNIHYILDEECIAAVELLFRLAAECDVLPPAPPLRIL